MQKLIPVEDAVLRDTFWNAAIDLKKENDALKDRIKRLEEAGDGLLTAMRDDWLEYVDWNDKTTDAIGKWNKAKENNL
jgi:hypothetical protein